MIPHHPPRGLSPLVFAAALALALAHLVPARAGEPLPRGAGACAAAPAGEAARSVAASGAGAACGQG